MRLLGKWASLVKILFFFLRFYLFNLREGQEGEKHQCVFASCESPTGDLTHNPGMCPDWESNQWPFGSQAGTQSTEPQPLNLWLRFLTESVTIVPIVRSLNIKWVISYEEDVKVRAL